MISRRSIFLLSGAFLASGWSSALAASGHDPIKAFDLDFDGTLDLAEVKKAAAELFMRLDPRPRRHTRQTRIGRAIERTRACCRRS